MAAEKSSPSQFQVLGFITIVCVVCALILSVLANLLRAPQQSAKELYRSEQLLLAAHLLDYQRRLIIDGSPAPETATKEEILTVFKSRILTRLTDDQGNLYTFQQVGIDEETYLKENEKLGYSQLPYKLLYVVKGDTPTPYGYVIPINGYGLWDAIYGYLGIGANGDTVLGMTWYNQKETPGLGGEIALPEWQKQFFGKEIFQKSSTETTHFQTAPLGIRVVKTTVEETFGNSPLAASAVDGIAGASITVTGVNEALRSSLSPYRPFLIRAAKQEVQIDGTP